MPSLAEKSKDVIVSCVNSRSLLSHSNCKNITLPRYLYKREIQLKLKKGVCNSPLMNSLKKNCIKRDLISTSAFTDPSQTMKQIHLNKWKK